MSKNSKSKSSCACLIGMHIGAFIIIGATIVTLCLLCKEKLAKIFFKMKNCACECKDECECLFEEVKDGICDCSVDASEKEPDSEN